MFARITCSLVVALMPVMSYAADVPACATAAAGEFRVPEKVFKAMVIQADGDRAHADRFRAREFGPMRLGPSLMASAEKSMGIDQEMIKTDACQNYRAAAWYLAQLGGVKFASDEKIWQAVANYFYGSRKMHVYPRAQEVKQIYRQL